MSVTAPAGIEGWTVTVVLRRHGGRAAIDEVTFRADDEGSRFGSRLMQQVRLGALENQIWERLRTGFGAFSLPDGWYDDFTQRRRPGRGKRDDYWYAVWAERYVKALDHHGRSPVKWLGEQYPKFGEAAIRAYIFKAREREILTPPPGKVAAKRPGMPGGQLTEYGRGLLDGTR